MGLFSKLKKVWKGTIGKVFKKIGKGIKKIVKKVGTAINKLGIVGQIGLMIAMPYLGAALGAAMGTVSTAVGTFIKGAAAGSKFLTAVVNTGTKVINLAAQFGSKVGTAFKTITSGVSKFIGDFAGAAANKLGFNMPAVADKTFGKAFGDLMTNVKSAGSAVADIFNAKTYNWTTDVASKLVGAGQSVATLETMAPMNTINVSSTGGAVSQAATKAAGESLLAPTAKSTLLGGLKDKFVSSAKELGKETLEKMASNAPKVILEEGMKALAGSSGQESEQQPYGQFEADYQSFMNGLANQREGYTAATGEPLQTYVPQSAMSYMNSNPYGQGAQVYNMYQDQLARMSNPSFG